jgi:hypothetical protein
MIHSGLAPGWIDDHDCGGSRRRVWFTAPTMPIPIGKATDHDDHADQIKRK